ncbi:MAG: hypothetical protein ACFB0B_16985 [Thermonemataceae bacterium]
MELAKAIENIAEEIDGSFTEYSPKNLIITVPIGDGRFQGVTTYLIERDGNEVIEFTSRVCDAELPNINFKHALEVNQQLTYSKVVIFEGFLQLAAAIIVKHITEDILKDIILEIGHSADKLERELTNGIDVH